MSLLAEAHNRAILPSPDEEVKPKLRHLRGLVSPLCTALVARMSGDLIRGPLVNPFLVIERIPSE